MHDRTNRPVRAPITASVMHWARASGGVSVEDLARSAGVSMEAVQSWEAGEARPTLNQVRAVADRLKRPLATFFLPAPPEDPPLAPDFRTVRNRPGEGYSAELLLELRKARFLQSRFAEEREVLQAGQRGDLLKFEVSDDPGECAARMRRQLGLSLEEQMAFRLNDCGLREWRSILYHASVLSYGFRLDRDQALGFALTQPLAPLAAINLAAAPPQRVFTLFHELGHLCLGLSGVSDAVTEEPHYGAANVRQAEVFCNRFASSLLLPLDHRRVIAAMDDLAGENTADDHRVGMVASRFRVSKYVLLHRMRDSGRLDRIQANRIIGTWVALDDEREEQRKEREREKRERDKADGRPIFGLTPVQNALSALGSDIVRDVLTAVDGGRIGEREAADLLQTSAKHFGGLSEKLAAARSHG